MVFHGFSLNFAIFILMNRKINAFKSGGYLAAGFRTIGI
jgi:predicted Zn-dependent protease